MKSYKKVFLVFRNPLWIIVFLNNCGLHFISDSLYLKILYRIHFNKKLDLKNPKTFNEKLQWLKIHDRKDVYTKMVDKYEAKKYVSKIIGKDVIIPTIGIYDNFDDINFDKLPKQFVIKCTHDSGGLIIVKDKSKLDIKNAKKKINKSLKNNFYYAGREWPYKNVKPRIIIEKYMREEGKEDITDYKLMCFNGNVKCSFVCLNRNSKNGMNIDFYDRDWNKMPFERGHYKNSGYTMNRPENYNLMIKLAEKLSIDIPFVRVDFYEIDKKVYFGELTFFPGSGFEEFNPQEYDKILGDWIELPTKKVLEEENEK